MITAAANRFVKLIVIEDAIECFDRRIVTVGGWKYARDAKPTDPDGDSNNLVETSADYVSNKFNSSDIDTPALSIGSLIGMWGDGTQGGTPFTIGSEFFGDVPYGSTE